MAEKGDEIWGAMAKVVSGESASDDQNLVDAWQNENEVNRKSLNLFLLTRFRKKEQTSEQLKDQVYNRVVHKINQDKRRSILLNWSIVGAAASITLLIVTAVLFYNLGNAGKQRSLIEVYVPNGVKSRIMLPDGTLVTLNSGTRIRYPDKFQSPNREIVLDGEAYFQVVKDKRHPFIVKAGTIQVQVLGTTFGVKAYGSENMIETTLEEGSVKITAANSQIVTLVPNEQAIWNKQSHQLHVDVVNAAIVNGWKDGKYYFKAKTFEEIARTLERVFNVTIIIKGEKLKKEVFTGEFERDENIETILKIIGKSTRMTYVIQGHNIIITEK